MSRKRALRWREVPLHQRTAVVRRASCGLQRQASAARFVRRRRVGTRCLGRRRSTRAYCARVLCRTGCGRRRHCERALHRRAASVLRRSGAVRTVGSGFQRQATLLRVSRGACASALAISGEEAQHSRLLLRALCRAGRRCSIPHRRALRRWWPLSIGTRLWCDVPSAASDVKPAPRVSRDAGVPALAVSGEDAQHSRLLRARCDVLAAIDIGTVKARCTGGRLLSFGTQPYCDVPATASKKQTKEVTPKTHTKRIAHHTRC